MPDGPQESRYRWLQNPDCGVVLVRSDSRVALARPWRNPHENGTTSMTLAPVGGATTSRLRGLAHPDDCAREARGVVSSESPEVRPGPLPALAEVPANPAGFEQRRNRSSGAPTQAKSRDLQRRLLRAFLVTFFVNEKSKSPQDPAKRARAKPILTCRDPHIVR
jgi:hypothetical protein